MSRRNNRPVSVHVRPGEEIDESELRSFARRYIIELMKSEGIDFTSIRLDARMKDAANDG